MNSKELVQALRRMGKLTGGLMCVGCGHEHNCSIHGCAAVHEAADALEAREEKWISVKDRLPEIDQIVLVVASGKPQKNITLENAIELAEYDPEGWILEMWPEWMEAKVTHWMPLPEPPEE